MKSNNSQEFKADIDICQENFWEFYNEVSSNIKCPPKRERIGKEKSPIEVVLVLVLDQIKMDTEIPWDVHSLLWKGTVREATSPGTSSLRCSTTT